MRFWEWKEWNRSTQFGLWKWKSQFVLDSFWWPEWTILRNLFAITQFYWKEPVPHPTPLFWTVLSSHMFCDFFFFFCFLFCVYPSVGLLLEMVCVPVWIIQARMIGERSGLNMTEFHFWFKDPEAEGKRELENDRIRESELEGVILESFHSWLEVPTLYSKFLSYVWSSYGGLSITSGIKFNSQLVKKGNKGVVLVSSEAEYRVQCPWLRIWFLSINRFCLLLNYLHSRVSMVGPGPFRW